jgi:hypothetical protein
LPAPPDFRDPETTGFDHAWVGMEPTFATKQSVRKWLEMSETPEGALPVGEQAAIAREVITGFVKWVEEAATKDPRPTGDSMEPHRHRIHPLLWKALERQPKAASSVVRREQEAWKAGRETYLGRRPRWSIKGAVPPWKPWRPAK